MGRNFLWKLRYGLHMITGRREDKLLFEHQRKLAEVFGYTDDRKSLGIEKADEALLSCRADFARTE